MSRLRILLLLALAAGAWLVWSWAPAAPAVPAGSVAASGRGDRPAGAAGPDSLRREEAAASGNASGVPQRVRVEVRLPDGDPAPGATVRYWPPRGAEQRARDDAAVGEDLEAALVVSGRVATTAEQGIVELDVDPGTTVCCRLDRLYGEGGPVEDAGDGVRRVLVALLPDVTVTVEVADLSGAPQEGILVEVQLQVATRSQGIVREEWQLTTDADGCAKLPHLQHGAGIGADALAGNVTFRCVRRTHRRTTEAFVEKSVEWSDLQQEPRVRVQVPPGGTIALRVADLDGVPQHHDWQLYDDRGVKFALSETEGELETFRALPLGRSWQVRLEERNLEVRGPVRAGETIRVDVPWPYHGWCFRGRVSRQGGVPFGDLGMRVTLTASGRELGVWPTTRMERPFELELYLDEAALPGVELRIDPAFNSLAGAQTYLFERPMVRGDVDLGELELPVLPALATLATVEVRCGNRVLTGAASLRLEDGRDRLPVIAIPRGDVIELRGRPIDGPLFLRCEHPDCQRPPPYGLRQGEHCRIELQPAARLRVDLVPLDVPREALCSVLTPLGSVGEETAVWPSGNSLCWAGLPPGAWSLRIRLGEQVLREERLQLSPGMNRWPEDGQPVDLRKQARVCRVLARSAAVPPELLRVEALQFTAGAVELPEDPQTTDGWFAPHAGRDLMVKARGYVPQRFASPVADVVLRMQPLTRLALELPPGAKGTDVRVRIVTDPVGDPALRQFDDEHSHDTEFRCDWDSEFLWFAPGAELEIRRLADDEPGPVQRVVVGAASPQAVVLR